MPKMKTHRGAAKRFSLNGKGKVKFKHCNLRHCLQQKGTDRKRKLAQTGYMDPVDAKKVIKMLGT